MPRDVSTGIYTLPPGTYGVPGQTVASSPYNRWADDVATDLNTPRPIVAGGTGGGTSTDALKNLNAERANFEVTDYNNTTEWISGSFWSQSSALNGPTTTDSYKGIAIVYNRDQTFVTLIAYGTNTGNVYRRERRGGAWTAWYAEQSAPNTSGRFSIGSTAARIRLDPYNGDQIKINGGFRVIPPAGVQMEFGTNSTVDGAAATPADGVYYVYAMMNPLSPQNIVLDLSFTPYVMDVATPGNVGTMIKSADPTRTLVGLCYIVGSGVLDSPTNRHVKSWMNRRRAYMVSSPPDRSTSSAPWTITNVADRISFVTWADEPVFFSAYGNTQNPAAGAGNYLGIGIDGTPVAKASIVMPANTGATISCSCEAAYGEGRHYADIMFGTLTGTMTLFGNSYSGLMGGVIAQ